LILFYESKTISLMIYHVW